MDKANPVFWKRPQVLCHTVWYLQAAENGEHVVEGEHITVDSHQAEQPGGTDEQQQQDSHSQSRAIKRHIDI